MTTMTQALKPATEDDVRDMVAQALADDAPIEIAGNGSKAALGRHAPLNNRLDVSGLSGITLYEPAELVLSAKAGTPLAEIEAAVAAEGQCLAFEPPDYGALLGNDGAAQTVGGIIACNLSGPRRFRAGAARDHLLGMRAISGRGELFKSGGRVVKNVTGYDLCKLMTGSFGTLGVMTELTLKVLPIAEKTRTVLVYGLDDRAGVAALAEALKSPHDVSAAAHLPQSAAARSGVSYVNGAGKSATCVRVEGPEPSVVARCETLRDLFAAHGEVEELHGHNSAALWREIGNVAPLLAPPPESGPESEDRAVWKLSVPPADGADVAAAMPESVVADALYDWGGGLVWLAVDAEGDASHEAVRRAVDIHGGHATLIRAPDAVRAAVPVFEPQPEDLAALSRRIKQGFDPMGILNPGRMYEGI